MDEIRADEASLARAVHHRNLALQLAGELRSSVFEQQADGELQYRFEVVESLFSPPRKPDVSELLSTAPSTDAELEALMGRLIGLSRRAADGGRG